jgi:predicted CoA-binding protein
VARTVAVLGASRDRAKYGNKSLRAHLRAGWDAYPVNPHGGTIEGRAASPDLSAAPVARFDRITVYLPPEIVLGLVDDLAAHLAEGGEVWLNPGSGDARTTAALAARGVRVVQGCSIVDVGYTPSDFPDS